MITTTLNRIRAHVPCEDGWRKLLTGLGKTQADDEPLPYAKIVEINGIEDALWCCRAEPQYVKEWRLFAVWCARQVQHLMIDPRSIAALDVAERHANGQATDEELASALDAAWDAARAAARDAAATAAGSSAWAAAWVAAWAAARASALDAAWAAARAAAWAAARDASWAAAWAAARASAWDDAWDTAMAAQTAKFIGVVGEGRDEASLVARAALKEGKAE